MIKVIYGAQGIALGVYNAMKMLSPELEIDCFLVSEMGINTSFLGGVPVRELAEFVAEKTTEEKANIEVLIGTPENVMEAIEKNLDEAGIYNHVRIDSVKLAEMQREAFVKTGIYHPLSMYDVGDKEPTIEMYKMIHHNDKPLISDIKYPDYLVSLQVGTAIAGYHIAEITDDTDSNISDKNGDYSELTGLYWIWKNKIKQQSGKYYGLAHYRRFLEISDDDQRRLIINNIDAVLPYPMPYEPNIEAHHLRYLSNSEWNAVIQALDELQPEYARAYKEISKQTYFYNYNLIVAKGNVLDDYCSWLFPLLFRIEEINDLEGEKQPNRYIGYIGETLETLYFMHNKDKLKIAHTGCRFII